MESLQYNDLLANLKYKLASKKTLELKEQQLSEKLKEAQHTFTVMLNAQKLLSSVSDQNTERTLGFITGMVNKVISEVFPNNTKTVYLEKKLYGGTKPHINVIVQDDEGNTLDLNTQEGEGLCQIISIMYVICLIEIRKGRRLLILDERLNGLHSKAKAILSEVLRIFAEGGFQFIFVEYSLNDLGKIYNIEKHGKDSIIVDMEGRVYSDDMVFTSEIPEFEMSTSEDEETVSSELIG